MFGFGKNVDKAIKKIQGVPVLDMNDVPPTMKEVIESLEIVQKKVPLQTYREAIKLINKSKLSKNPLNGRKEYAMYTGFRNEFTMQTVIKYKNTLYQYIHADRISNAMLTLCENYYGSMLDVHTKLTQNQDKLKKLSKDLVSSAEIHVIIIELLLVLEKMFIQVEKESQAIYDNLYADFTTSNTSTKTTSSIVEESNETENTEIEEEKESVKKIIADFERDNPSPYSTSTSYSPSSTNDTSYDD